MRSNSLTPDGGSGFKISPASVFRFGPDRQRSNAPATTDPFRKVDAAHVYSLLDKEVERLKEGPGAVDLLGLKSVVPFEGYRLYPPNDRFCEAAHAQGGYVDAEKIVWRDIAALVALGHIDFAGIVHNHFNRHDVEFETDSWGMIPKDRPEFSTVAGMPLEHGSLLSLSELRLSPASIGWQRFRSEGRALGPQSGLCEDPKALQLRRVV